MKELTRGDFLKYAEEPLVKVELPHYEGFVYVRKLNLHQMEAFEKTIVKADLKDMRVRLFCWMVVDQNGSPLFSEDDIPTLSFLKWIDVAPAIQAAMEANKKSD